MDSKVGHSFPTDWWTLGILTYELIMGAGYTPYNKFEHSEKKMLKVLNEGTVPFPSEK